MIVLRLPDLPPLECELRWSDHYNAGVQFRAALSDEQLAAWLSSRASMRDNAEIEAFVDDSAC